MKANRPIDPRRDALMRTVWSVDSDEMWNSRSAENKAMMVVREMASRLGGLSTIASGLSFAEMAKRGCHAHDPLRSEYYYFAIVLKDAANLLEATHKAWWDATCDLDEPRSKATAKAAKRVPA
jgi:hypothetical protein